MESSKGVGRTQRNGNVTLTSPVFKVSLLRGHPRCKNLWYFSLSTTHCFNLFYCAGSVRAILIAIVTSLVRFTGSYTEDEPFSELLICCPQWIDRRKVPLFDSHYSLDGIFCYYIRICGRNNPTYTGGEQPRCDWRLKGTWLPCYNMVTARFEHGLPCYTMVTSECKHGLQCYTMVSAGPKHGIPWYTMVIHETIVGFKHGWPCSTMVLFDHGRYRGNLTLMVYHGSPWFYHCQNMVNHVLKRWSTMVKPW